MCKRRLCLTAFLTLALAASSAFGDITTGLVGHWPFNGDTQDVSGRGNHGTINGNAALAPDRFGTPDAAMFFPGEADAYVFVGDQPDFQITGALTLTAWVFLNSSNANNGRIVAKAGGSGSRSWNLNIEATSGGVTNPAAFQISATGAATLGLLDSEPLPTDQWVHLAGVYRPGEAMELYVDGQLHASSTSGIPDAMSSDNGLPVLIGSRNACSNCGWDGFIDDVRIYTRALTPSDIGEVVRGDVNLSSNPSPADEATDVPRDTVLSWSPGEKAATHDVYFGTAFDDVNNATGGNPMDVLVSAGQIDERYDPAGMLDFETTYYWRVDEVNAPPDRTVFKGNIWSFTTEPVGYPITDIIATASGAQAGSEPEKTVDGSGLDENDGHSIDSTDMWLTPSGAGLPAWIQYEFDRVYRLHEMWVWNYNVQFELVLGFGLKDVTIEYSEDGENWTALGDVELAKATATPGYTHNTTVDLQGVSAKYVRLNVNSGWGMLGQFGLSEVRFIYIPVQSREPEPADGATGIEPDTVLSWRAGRDAATHEVYLGTDADSLDLLDSTAQTSITPGDLSYGQTYYWRVDEVNDAEAVPTWAGEAWNFSTTEFMLIDDFETYTDDIDAAETIFDTWIDGWVNGNGSTVGYFDAPFAERTIVHSGAQSMPLAYDNSASPFYSEAQRDLGGMDWDVHGADTLRLFVYGRTPGFAELADGTIVMNGIGADIWGTADEFRYVHKTLSGDGSLLVRVDSLADSDVWAKGGVMIRETVEPGSAFAAVYLTGDNGVRFQARLEADASAVSDSDVVTAEQIALREPVWVKIERVGNMFNGYYSTNGADWTAMAWNPQTIAMANDVTIGLALTSHNATVSTGATFADVTSTGNVTGNWQIAEVGVAQPTEGNDPQPLYVAIEDGAGHVATVTNPDAAIRSGWNEWQIPFNDLANVNLSNVQTMTIGLGDPDNPTAGGTGLVFIDDISYGHPAGQ